MVVAREPLSSGRDPAWRGDVMMVPSGCIGVAMWMECLLSWMAEEGECDVVVLAGEQGSSTWTG